MGVKNGDHLKLPVSNVQLLTLKLSAIGGARKKWWFLNGNLIQETVDDHSFNYVFNYHGKQQLAIMDEAGKTAFVEFSLD